MQLPVHGYLWCYISIGSPALAWVCMTREMNPPASSPRAWIEGSSLSLSHFIYVEYVSVNLLIRLSFVSDFFDAANEGLLLADPGSGNVIIWKDSYL
jgi:hypothetical protein